VVAFGVALHLQLGGPVGRSLDLLKHLYLLGGEVRRRSAADVIKRFFLVRRSGKISRLSVPRLYSQAKCLRVRKKPTGQH
jgi:hypothetical protein